jgi:hypothetical protein
MPVEASQMAEGIFNQKYAPKGCRAISAGTRPASQINPLVVQVSYLICGVCHKELVYEIPLDFALVSANYPSIS